MTNDLYPGARVRLASGEDATVIDAGAYLRPNMLVASAGPTARPRGVLIELASGERRDVARSELTVVPPAHPCRGEPDPTEFERVKSELEPLSQGSWKLIVREFVPARHKAVALVLHPWERDNVPVHWQEVVRATKTDGIRALSALQEFHIGEFAMHSEGQPDLETMRTLIAVLSRHTTAPDDVFFAVWEGWGGDQWEWFPDAAHVYVPHRGCWLLRVPIEGALAPVSEPAFRDTLRPLIWWPADRSWTVHTDVDWRWTIVAGTDALVSELERDPALEVMRTTFDGPSTPA